MIKVITVVTLTELRNVDAGHVFPEREKLQKARNYTDSCRPIYVCFVYCVCCSCRRWV